MKVQLTTVDKKKYIVELQDFDTVTEVARFQMFVKHFLVNGFWLVEPTKAIIYQSVILIELVAESKA